VVAKWNTIKRLAIDEHRNNTVGWFVMITNDVKDPVKAMEIYRRKDAVEKGFDDLKNDLDCKRL
jgi:transposase